MSKSLRFYLRGQHCVKVIFLPLFYFLPNLCLNNRDDTENTHDPQNSIIGLLPKINWSAFDSPHFYISQSRQDTSVAHLFFHTPLLWFFYFCYKSTSIKLRLIKLQNQIKWGQQFPGPATAHTLKIYV